MLVEMRFQGCSKNIALKVLFEMVVRILAFDRGW
jgi:hypothetical protein